MKIKTILICLFFLSITNLLCWIWPVSNSSTPDTFISAFGPRVMSGRYDFS